MFRDVLLIAGGRQEPVARAVGVGHGFLSSKGFRRDQEQGGFRVHRFQYFGDVGTIDVRNKMHIQVIFIRAQRFGHHERTQIGAADTDVDDVGNRFTGVAFPAAGDNGFGEGFHLLKHGVHFRHHVFAINQNRSIAAVTQRNVQHRAVFRAVNLLAGEHGFNGVCQEGLFGQVLQFCQRLFGDAVFGKIHQHQIVERGGEFRETIAILREQIRDGNVFHFIKVFL